MVILYIQHVDIYTLYIYIIEHNHAKILVSTLKRPVS
jgi:hypothetical protein